MFWPGGGGAVVQAEMTNTAVSVFIKVSGEILAIL
jgi:hypothetical protein